MDRKIIVTDDNSKTLLIPELNETYHSTKGAVQEAKHVFIDAGLSQINSTVIHILEMGFGTGLNALLSLDYAERNNVSIFYTALEAYPIGIDLALKMDYLEPLNFDHFQNEFEKMHNCPENVPIELSKNFTFLKILEKLENSQLQENLNDLIYYDAFGPKVQAHLWTKDSLSIIRKTMKTGSKLVSYCAQGQFKRNLKALNFSIESIPGPPGKREMTRATLNNS